MKSVIIRKKSTAEYRLFAVCPGGLEVPLRDELANLQVTPIAEYPGGIEFNGTLETAYLCCLSLRTASRVLLLLKEESKILNPDDLYAAVKLVDWTRVFRPPSTFAVYLTESHTQPRKTEIAAQFWALKAKDAIADVFRDKMGERPDVDRQDPDVTIRLHLHNQTLKIYFDLSGKSLHERGYRKDTGAAPLKENLAAGLLMLAGYNAKLPLPLLDPFCGSGTLLIEAGLIAIKKVPGLFRHHYGFLAWRDHQRSTYETVRARLESQVVQDLSVLPPIKGSDIDPEMVARTRTNLHEAGLGEWIQVEIADAKDTRPYAQEGILICNPPYGLRMGDESGLVPVYQQLGTTLKHQFKGWTAAILTSNLKLMQAISLKPSKKHIIHNGAIDTLFHIFKMF